MRETHPTGRSRLARKLVIDLSIMTVIGLGLAFIGPFGSFAQPLAYRVVSWLGFAYIGYCIYSPMSFVVGKWKAALDLPEPGLWVAAVLLATIPMTAMVWSVSFLPGPIMMPSLEEALISYVYVLIIGGGVTGLFYALEKRSGPDTPQTDHVSTGPEVRPEPELPQPRFFERLPPALGTDLIALEMEDHYVRAHTALGSDLILLRMRDAVAELDDLEGAQVHRSWWVARSAVQGTRREGRNMRLLLSKDLEAPVSRAAVPMLKDAGWF